MRDAERVGGKIDREKYLSQCKKEKKRGVIVEAIYIIRLLPLLELWKTKETLKNIEKIK